MQNLESLVAHQQAQINALKKKRDGGTLDRSETLILELTIGGKSPVQIQERQSIKIIDLTTDGKSHK